MTDPQRVNPRRPVRIANGAGFWGDHPDAPLQLVQTAELDYLTLEYLAELTLSILAYQKARDDRQGYVTEFPELVDRLADSLRRQPGLKIVTNAGGMNPQQCAVEVGRRLAQAGQPELPIAAVDGDDIFGRIDELQQHGESLAHLDRGDSLDTIRDRLVSANVYLGADGILDALDDGARIVITGRVADASLLIGPARHEFGWSADHWQALGQATVAGHLIECGAQATGGIAGTWTSDLNLVQMGYPIAELGPEGECVITRPEGSGGRVTVADLAEQLVYEIGDPARYLTPDVVADFTAVELIQESVDRVRVVGGGGTARPERLKASLAYRDGYMVAAMVVVAGRNAVSKARFAGDLIGKRLAAAGERPHRYHYEVLGAGDSAAGVIDSLCQPWEVVLRVVGQDPSRERLERMVREVAPLVTSGPPGVTGYTGGRPRPHPVFAFWPATIARDRVQPRVRVCSAAEWAGRPYSLPAREPN